MGTFPILGTSWEHLLSLESCLSFAALRCYVFPPSLWEEEDSGGGRGLGGVARGGEGGGA